MALVTCCVAVGCWAMLLPILAAMVTTDDSKRILMNKADMGEDNNECDRLECIVFRSDRNTSLSMTKDSF
ncbi:MAG: hypothetical protein PUP92_28205 [Rhizonema sp. PD38]|nr:hypothetical protein [Rhizonema sp. PD38]